jgi:hypothetical protein
MQRQETILVAVASLIIGMVIGSFIRTPTAKAQDAGPWQISHGSWMQGGNISHGGYYAIRHNVATGETWVLTVKDGLSKDDGWVKLPEETRQNKK